MSFSMTNSELVGRLRAVQQECGRRRPNLSTFDLMALEIAADELDRLHRKTLDQDAQLLRGERRSLGD